MTLLVAYFILAIGVSFLCSILESVLLSVTPSYIGALEQRHKKAGRRLEKLKTNVDRPLAAILSLNTIAHTVGAAGVGAQAAIVFENISVGVVSAVLTALILIFSEIIPKTLGANYWRNLAGVSAIILEVLIVGLYPLVWMSQQITRLLERKEPEASVSRDEVSAMADLGHREGVFEERESTILKNLLWMKSVTAKDVMTPRTVVFAASEETEVQELFKDPMQQRFSRIPIYNKSIDNTTGYIHKHDMLEELAKDHHHVKLKDIKREIIAVPENMKLPALFEQLISSREHVAIVVDEYGGMSGMVTMEDIIETLLGLEIVDEYDSTVDMQSYARKKWKLRAEKQGIISLKEEEEKQFKKEKEDTIKLGITGGQEPRDESK